jgi:glycogen debranching enzyme
MAVMTTRQGSKLHRPGTQAAAGLNASDAEVPFYIPATRPPTRPRRSLKHGDCFAVFDSHGDIGAVGGGPDGLYYCDTRHLSLMELMINGMQPLLLGSNVRDDNTALTVDLTNPDFYFDRRLVLPKDTLHIVRTLFLWRATAYQRLRIESYGDRPVEIKLTLAFASDFADVFEVRGLRRERRGVARATLRGPDSLVLNYEGLDGVSRRTWFYFEPAPAEFSRDRAAYTLRLRPGEHETIYVAVRCGGDSDVRPMPFIRGLHRSFRERKEATDQVTMIETSNDIFNEVLRRSMADLCMLVTETPQGPYPYGGIPWYSTVFGRDGLITALQLLWCDPRLARGVLRRLAAYQAKDYDARADAEPGKILHEMRFGEMAALREIPFGLYYGSVDSTPLFVLLAGLYAAQTRDMDTLRELWPNIERALAWIDGPGDADGDGFIEYHRSNEQGLVNQGWKDSFDAVFHADGSLAKGPIALVEVQGYVYAAKRAAARCARWLGNDALAERLDAQATRLAEQFETAFWCDEIGTYALALDGDKQQCRVRSSNAGQALFTGIARPDRAARVARELLRPTSFSGWGIRTVPRGERRYNPMSYHNGSIWPHDNAMIAAGFARYGIKGAVDRVFEGLFAAAGYLDLRRLPELFCGFQRTRGRGPTLYPVACSPQSWAASTPFALLQAALGLEFDPDRKEILLRNPRLPVFLDRVVLRNLHLAGSSVDLAVTRHGADVSLQVLRKRGQISVAAVHP